MQTGGEICALNFRIEFSAIHGQRTFSAVGISGGTAVPAEEDNPVAEITAFLRRQNGPKLFFHLFRLFPVTES
jgi:hypothetical protein